MLYEFTIEGYIPRSPNAGARKHWGRKMEERMFWEGAISRQGIMHGLYPVDRGKPFVSYEIHKPGKVKLRDEDNLVASIKHCQDALTNLGYIEDDSNEHIVFGGVAEYNGKDKYRTIIRIEYP